MPSTPSALTTLFRNELIHQEAVTRYAPARRFASLFSEASPADAVYFLDSGLVKVYKRGEDGKEIILRVVAPGEIFGEQALVAEEGRKLSAEILQEGVIYVVPKAVFNAFCDNHPGAWRMVAETLGSRQRELEKKVELLCLQDVEYRILYYLSELATTLGHRTDAAAEYAIPLSQSELASLIGATRETTSTTLNALARRGLVRLGRRLLIVTSLDSVRNAASERTARAANGAA
jgi:CRP/FNR family transcriptional regulator, cyclic AMP receptor protein